MDNKKYLGSNSFLRRHIFNILGVFSVMLAVIGIILPVMPTTVFLLLAAYFFARGSEKFHDWFSQNKLFGRYLDNYRSGRGMTRGSKFISLLFLWAGITYSTYSVEMTWLKILLLAIAVGVTVHVLKIKTYREENSS